MLLGTRAPSSTATTTPISADSAHQPSGLPDPLPGFFSSLPAQGVTDPSKYAGVVAGASAAINNGAHDSGGGNSSGSGGNRESARATQGSGLLNAAAAAAAASVASGAGHPDAYRHPGGPVALLDAGYPQGSSPYARHPYSGAPATLLRPQEQSSYALDGFSLSSHGPTATPALGPSLSEQSVAHINTAASAAAELARGGGGESEPASAAVLAGAASSPDLTAYSLSAFSRPLGQQTDSAAVLLGSNPGNYAGGCSSVNTPGLVGSLSAVGHISGVVSPPPQQSVHYYQQQPQQQQQQQQQQPPHQQRGYSDYSSYYRSPSTTLGMGGAAAQATNAAGASPLNDPGLDGIGSGATSSAGTGVSQLSAAAAAAAAAAMGPAYYAPTAYQQYARSAAVGAQSAAYSYYYSQPSARYLPYAAYPPVRHFVSPARPFKCETCEQSFSRNHDLKRHVKIHSGVKPHKCPKCGKSFGRSDALKRHSMVKRCRSSTAGNAESSSGSQGAESAGSASSQRQTVSARLAPVSSLFSQPATATPSSSAIMSTMLASRANPI
ncbi:transcriptional regulator of sulfur amino acid metabolism [Coemansia spiralis]|nr:transcriptional regulator of sulfur amino acid metabolism [Coemansia spiralis]